MYYSSKAAGLHSGRNSTTEMLTSLGYSFSLNQLVEEIKLGEEILCISPSVPEGKETDDRLTDRYFWEGIVSQTIQDLNICYNLNVQREYGRVIW